MIADEQELEFPHVSPPSGHVSHKRRLSVDTPSPPLTKSSYRSPFNTTASYTGSTVPLGDESSSSLSTMLGPLSSIYFSRLDELQNTFALERAQHVQHIAQLKTSYDALQLSTA